MIRVRPGMRVAVAREPASWVNGTVERVTRRWFTRRVTVRIDPADDVEMLGTIVTVPAMLSRPSRAGANA